MAHHEFFSPDVSEYLTRVTAIEKSTRQRIANSAASSAEGSVFATRTVDTLRASYQGLAARSDPFTVHTFGSRDSLDIQLGSRTARQGR